MMFLLSANNLKSLLKSMICIKTEIPQEIFDIKEELKAIYQSKDAFCIWALETRADRNKFMDEIT
jgi:hypothetical protein